MVRNNRDIERVLSIKFNFVPAEHRGSDHRWFELNLPGSPTIRTKFSHSSGDVHSGLEAKIARQLHVRPAFFREMIECTKAREDYYQQVSEAPYPPFSQMSKDKEEQP